MRIDQTSYHRIACTMIMTAFSLVQSLPSSADDLSSAQTGRSQRTDSASVATNSTSTPPGGSERPGQSVPQPANPTGGINLMDTVPGKTASSDRISLTLAGGGARGAAHIGVLRVLEQEGIKPDFVAGTSMGAVVGGLYCAGVPLDEIQRLILSGEMEKAFFPCSLNWQAAKYVPSYLLKRAFGIKPLIGLYSGKSVAKFINKNVPADSKNIEDLKIPFAAIGTNLLDTRSYWITKGDIGQAVQASSTVPFLYRPVKLDGRIVVDGGLRTPLGDVSEVSGSRTIIAVKLQSTLDAKSDKHLRTVVGYSERLCTMFLAEIESHAVASAELLIEPDVQDSTMESFAEEDILRSIQAGETAARKMIPKIKAKLAARRTVSPM